MDARPHPNPDASIRTEEVPPSPPPGRSGQGRPVSASPHPPHSIPPLLDLSGTAFFLDFDGTLVEIAPRPDMVHVSNAIRRLLGRLSQRSDGAVAVVSGRGLDDVDAHLHPLILPASGGHGLQRRTAAGAIHSGPVEFDRLERVSRHVAAFAKVHPGLICEPKAGSVALHYRERPDLSALCTDFARRISVQEGARVMGGKMVVEIIIGRRTKADAIADFMREPPFRGRVPVYAGDDITDEIALAHVASLGGVTVKVGPGATVARYRVETVADFLRWLASLAQEEVKP